MKNNILIDTNIILDFFLSRKPFDKEASKILSNCVKKHNGFITIITISTTYYILRKLGSHKKVIKNLKKLMQLVTILNANNKIVNLSLESEFKNFEDALQFYSSTVDSNIDYIITRNIKDFKLSSIPVLTPKIYLNMNN
jgi:predicted nucleic acid-binding protein